MDQRALGWYGHMMRLDEDSLTNSVWKAEASGVRLRGRPGWMDGWMDGVERALGMRGLAVE